MNCGSLLVTLGALLAHEGDFGSTLRSLWDYFWAYRCRMACIMHVVSPCVRSKRVHKQKILIFAKDFACPRGARRRQPNEQPSGPVGPDRLGGSLWGHFGYLWVTLGHLMVTLQSLWSHFGYMKVPFQKTLIFPYRF